MPLTDPQWTRFLAELKKKKCCLLLGPEINCLSGNNGKSITVLDAFSQYMQRRLVEENVTFDPAVDNFFYRANKFINNQYANRSYQFADEIQSFSTEISHKPPQYFQKLIKLPFNSIVSMVPDNFVPNTLQQAGYEFVGEFYDYTDSAKKNIELAEEMQLVYNIFGSFDRPGSVAVTEKELLAQIKSIVAGTPGIPFQITNRFKDETKSFLFLGFNFDTWHFRLIIDSLQIPKPNFSFYPIYSATHEVALMTQEFYTEKFGMQFVEPDTDVFLTSLISKYETIYGSLDDKLLCVLDYHDDNIEQFRAFKKQLEQNGIAIRMDFFNKEAAQNLQLLNENASKADVYIPFISSSFIGDPDCLNRARLAINQPNTSMVPIITGYTSYETSIPGIKQKKLMVLPRDGKALSSYQANELTQVCYELARIINCIIR